MGRQVGIDLGTCSVLVFVSGKGIVTREPSVVAKEVSSNKVIAVGNEAKCMLGRTPGSIVAVRPLRQGVITDYDVTLAMLKYFLKQSMPWFPPTRPVSPSRSRFNNTCGVQSSLAGGERSRRRQSLHP